GQDNGEGAAPARPLAGRLDRAAVQLGDPAREGEPDAEAAPAAVDPVVTADEQLEDALEQRGRDAVPGIAHREGACVTLAPDADGDAPAARSVLEGIDEQI